MFQKTKNQQPTHPMMTHIGAFRIAQAKAQILEIIVYIERSITAIKMSTKLLLLGREKWIS
jgi:hypothetical protein